MAALAEVISFWVMVAVYAIAILFVVGALVFKREVAERWAWRLSWAGMAVHTINIGIRWARAGHLPYVLDYENIIMGTWVVMAVYLAVGWKWRNLRLTGVGVLPFVLLSLGFGSTLSSNITPVTAPYRSVWLGVHVTFAWFTYAAYTICAALGFLELMKGREDSARYKWLERVPEPEVLRERTMRFVSYGFLVNGVMIASGAIWAYDLWGAYWQWDPVETWSLITWLAFGLYLHGWFTLGWRDKRLAWLAIFALFGVLMTFWGVQMLPSSYHLFRSIGETMNQTGRPQMP